MLEKSSGCERNKCGGVNLICCNCFCFGKKMKKKTKKRRNKEKKKRIIETETEKKKMIEVLFRKCERLEVNKYLVV
jgi:hypothetical protein